VESKIFVLVLGYKDLKNLDECFNSLLKQNYGNYKVYFADNNSKDGSVEYVKKNFSKVKTFQFTENSGYAGGNNRLIKKAFGDKADFCLILNADTKVDKNLLMNLMKSYKEKSKKNKVGLIQPTVMLYDQPKKINTIGNIIHYLGFGYCGNYLTTKISKKDKEIISVSGTAMLISRDYYKDVGLLDEDFFMYNEDQNYSWRGLMLGYKHFLSVKGKIWHKYNFSKNKNKMYHSEKNRLMMILENYEKKTLLKLLPIIILNEVLILVYSLFNGWFILKLKSYEFLMKNKDNIKKKRGCVQQKRVISDLKIIFRFESKLDFSELNNSIVRYLINPIYRWYFKLVV
jgi:GT2 family glycosyltransferase